MMWMLPWNIVCLALVGGLTEAAPLVEPVSAKRHLQQPGSRPTATPEVVDFDGDMDAILALALAKANGEYPPSSEAPSAMVSDVPSTAPSWTSEPTASFGPTQAPLQSSNFCSGALLDHLEIVTWKYTIETVPGADIQLVMGEVQEILQEELIPLLLACRNPDNAPLDIVALESTLPPDRVSSDTVCAPEVSPSNTCTAVDGRLRLFLSDASSASEALAATRASIQEVVETSDFVFKVEAGLVRITFLVQDTASPGTGGTGGALNGEIGMSVTSFMLVAFASAALVVFVGSVYYWRRGGDSEGAATQAAGSSIYESRQQEIRESGSHSPFSEMLPSAYRFNENMSILSGHANMSPVNEDDASLDTSNSIMVSESGYTVDGIDDSSLFELPPSVYRSDPGTPELLGARKRFGKEITESMQMQTDLSVDSSSADIPPAPSSDSSYLLTDNTEDGQGSPEVSLLGEHPTSFDMV